VFAGMGLGFGVMLAMLLVQAGGTVAAGAGGPGAPLLFAGGVVAAAAMVLPGVSGGYLLLLLGLYIPILDAVDQIKIGLRARDLGAMIAVVWVVAPLGLGVLVGVVGVSHLIKWLLMRFEKVTVGVLLGLLLGAFLGLYPFQRPVEPEPGTVIRGRVVTQEVLEAGEVKPKDWPVAYFAPSAAQIGVSLLLIGAAATSTVMISRVGRRRPKAEISAGS
jgi:putative membrane protein